MIGPREQPDALTIGELAERTGVRAGTLRMWESRYGFPTPARTAGRQRRYPAETVALLTRVLTDRADGRSLATAIERAQLSTDTPELSLFAFLRRRRPQLPVHRLRKHAVIALSRAIEDECSSAGPSTVLIGGFQTESQYRAAERRWVELARTAQTAFVFAEFTGPVDLDRHPMEIPFVPDHPLRREWIVITAGPRVSACLAGWETPGQRAGTDSDRTFETIWTAERDIVWELTNAAYTLAAGTALGAADRLARPARPAAEGHDLELLTAITNRMIGYLASPSP